MASVALHPAAWTHNISRFKTRFTENVTFLFLARFPNAYVCIRRLITLRTGSKAQEHRLDEGKKWKQYKTKQIFLILAMEEDLDDLRVLG